MRRIAGVFGVVALAGVLIACGGGGSRGKNGNSGVSIADYDSSPALDAVIAAHRDAVAEPQEPVIYTTWFLNGDPRVALFSSVSPSGEVRTWQYMHAESGIMPGRTIALGPPHLDAIHQAIAALPPSQNPALEHALFVSTRVNGAWTTRVYDRTKRPDPLSNIFKTTGAPVVPE